MGFNSAFKGLKAEREASYGYDTSSDVPFRMLVFSDGIYV